MTSWALLCAPQALEAKSDTDRNKGPIALSEEEEERRRRFEENKRKVGWVGAGGNSSEL